MDILMIGKSTNLRTAVLTWLMLVACLAGGATRAPKGVTTFDTAADLAAYDWRNVAADGRATVVLRGWATAGDGRGGLFSLQATNTTTPTNTLDTLAARSGGSITGRWAKLSEGNRSVRTLAELDDLIPAYDGEVVEVTEWSPAKEFTYVATSTNTPTAIEREAATGGRWRHSWDGDVRVFGAKGDGVTDDSAAIDAATAVALSGAYGKLFFPAGTYIHSGWYIFPVTNTLLQIRGESANPASAVDPYGTRILLKPGSTSDLLTIQFTNDFTKRLRPDVANMYFDGNRYECPGARDVVVLSGKPGPATNYISCGQWNNCMFNRGVRHGLLITNHLFQADLQHCNLQSNGDTGIFLDRGGDHKFTDVLVEKAGVCGFYSYKAVNVTWQDSDIGFCDSGVKLDDALHTRFVNTDISFHGRYCVELYSSSSQNNLAHTKFTNCRIGSANASQSGIPTVYPSGTYSAVVLTGNSALSFGHTFNGCQMFCSELGSTTLPKHVFEDQRSASIFVNAPGFGVSIIDCAISSAATYTASGIYSPGFNENAQILAHANHGTTLTVTNQLNGLELRGRFNSYGIANFGNATNLIPALNIDGGASATAIQTWNRSGASKFGLAISGNILRVMDETEPASRTQVVAFEDTASAASMYLGGDSGTPRTAAVYSTLPSGTDAPSAPIRLYSLGTGAGAATAAGFDVNLPIVGSSGTSLQNSYQALSVRPTSVNNQTPVGVPIGGVSQVSLVVSVTNNPGPGATLTFNALTNFWGASSSLTNFLIGADPLESAQNMSVNLTTFVPANAIAFRVGTNVTIRATAGMPITNVAVSSGWASVSLSTNLAPLAYLYGGADGTGPGGVGRAAYLVIPP